MTFSCPELTLEEVLALARRIGYDGIEPRLVSGHGHGIEIDTPKETRKVVAETVEKSGIKLACVATSCRYADPDTAAENVQITHESIDLASDVGCKSIRVFGGAIGKGLSRDEAITLVVDSLKSLAEHAAERDVTVCMETHDDWCDPSHVVEVMNRVSHKYVCVNWDIMHPVRMGLATMDEAFASVRPWIRHVHVHDGKTGPGAPASLELVPIGEGYVDHSKAVELLASINYDGYLSGEWMKWTDPFESHLPRELKTLRAFESGA